MKEERKAYAKAYRQAHKEERKAYAKAWKEAHKDQLKAYMKSYKQANKERLKEYQKSYKQAHKEQYKAYRKAANKAWYEAHKDQVKVRMKVYNQAHNDQAKARMKSDVNSLGQTKHSIRMKSRLFLAKCGIKIPGYQIHHCFGYEDPTKFIYCSKSLHLKIHQFLRDNKIDANSDHWMAIRDLVNSTDEFWYIKD